MLSAETIAIGSELLAPDRTDTNSLWLTDQLNRIGIDVKLKTIVGDDDARLEELIKDAVKRSRVVITTGGLGPTEDDITRKVVARALGQRLLLDENVLAEIRTRFQNLAGDLRFARRILRVAGMGESAVDEKIAPIYTQYENPQTTILLNSSQIEIHLRAHARTGTEAEALLDDLSLKIEKALGDAVFAFRGETMEEVIGRRLMITGFTLAVAESCTGGLIAQRITNVPGSSTYFVEGVVTYSNESKTRLLGVDKKLIRDHGAVSKEVARDMARGVRHRAKTDFGLAVTGIAGPGGGTEEKPVGLVYIALADEAHTEHKRLKLPGDRELVRWRASQAALDMLRRRLI